MLLMQSLPRLCLQYGAQLSNNSWGGGLASQLLDAKITEPTGRTYLSSQQLQ